MNDEEAKCLERFYDNLYGKILLKYKKVAGNSIITKFNNIKSNDRMELLNNSSIERLQVPHSTLDTLINQDLVRETDSVGRYVITAKGVWEIESRKGIMSLTSLLNLVDDKFFNIYKEAQTPISEKHKLILFAMIATRAFSSDSSVDLKMGEKAKNAWMNILSESYDFLSALGVVKNLPRDQIFGRAGNEHPVSNVFRHTDKVPKQTRGLFKAPGDQKYFLDVCEGSSVSSEKLGFLLSQIFNQTDFNISVINKISEFCNRIASTQNVYVFAVSKHIFSNPIYDNIIRDALLKV